MTTPADWGPVEAELAHWAAAGHAARLWLRDDDAVAVTPALQRLAAIARSAAIPLMLAVIPAGAEPGLADFVARQPAWRVAVHGFAHHNHAPAGDKKAELGAHRPRQAVLADIARGLDWLDGLFAARLMPVLVPPWNRIDPQIVPELPRLGIEVLSAFGPEPTGLVPAPRRLNTHVDIIDWRGSRGGIDHDRLIVQLAQSLAEARQAGGRPVGILTHHLVHDAAAWGFVEALAAFVRPRRDIAWWPPERALSGLADRFG
jgi:hypothetical protein